MADPTHDPHLQFLTFQQVCALSQFSEETVRRAITSLRLQASRPGGKELRISVADYLLWMRESIDLPTPTSAFRPPVVPRGRLADCPRLLGSWASATPLELAEELRQMCRWIGDQTQGTLSDPVHLHIALRPADWEAVTTRPLTSAGMGSILDCVCREHGLGVDRVTPNFGLQDSWGEIRYVTPDGVVAWAHVVAASDP